MPRQHAAPVNLHRLRCFLAVVDTGTVTAAARRLRIAQPALSRQVHALEREVGLQLFTRHHNKLRLTPAGVEFARMVRHLIVLSDDVHAAAGGLASGAVRRLVVAATPTTITGLIAPFVATLGAADPLLLTRPAGHLELYDALRGGVDAIVSPASPEAGFARHRLGAVALRAFVSPDHPWARERRAAVGLAELTGQPLILPSDATTSRRVLDTAVARCGLAYDAVEECDDGNTVQANAAAGRGVAVLTDPPRFGTYPVSVREDSDDPGSELTVHLHAAWRPQHYASSLIEDLVRRLGRFLGSPEHLRPHARHEHPGACRDGMENLAERYWPASEPRA